MLVYFILTGLIILLFAGMVFALSYNTKNEQRKRVLNVVQGSGGTNKDSKKGGREQRQASLKKKLKDTGDLAQKPKRKALVDMILQAGLSISVKDFWVYSAVFALICIFLLKVLKVSGFVLVALGITAFLGVPRVFLKIKAKSRQKTFLKGFADTLESMVRLLKAGMPVADAISTIARETEGPMSEEMSRIYDQQKMGTPLQDALLEASHRMPIPEMKMFSTAVAIQAQTGSSLSEILTNLAGVIRARFALRRKVEALSSEAKTSAMIIGALPLVVALGMYFINTEYIEVLFFEPKGKVLLAAAIGWMLVGIFIMRQMINFKV